MKHRFWQTGPSELTLFGFYILRRRPVGQCKRLMLAVAKKSTQPSHAKRVSRSDKVCGSIKHQKQLGAS